MLNTLHWIPVGSGRNHTFHATYSSCNIMTQEESRMWFGELWWHSYCSLNSRH